LTPPFVQAVPMLAIGVARLVLVDIRVYTIVQRQSVRDAVDAE
jgi:hypothetical protein